MVTIEDAKKVAETLSKNTDPVSVIIFGFVAKTGTGSDLDLLIVMEKEGMQAEVGKCLRDRRLMNIAADYNIHIVCTDDDIDFIDRGRYPAEEGLLPLNPPTSKDASRSIKIAENIFSQLPLLV